MKNISSIAKKILSKKILVIGDMMLDSYLKGTTTRLCREAPVPIVNLQTQEEAPGGAANTALNVAVLGAKTKFISVGGNDVEGHILVKMLSKQGIDVSDVILSREERTIVKQRVISDQQLLVRYDYGSTVDMSSELRKQILTAVEKNFPLCDGMIISDYGYGVIFPELISLIAQLQKKHSKIIVVDSKNLKKYKDVGITAVKPNYGETLELLKIKPVEKEKRVDQILEHGKEILEIAGTKIAALTIDTEGALIFEKDKEPIRTYTKPQENSKAAGAGDTYVSALTTALVAEASTEQAAEIAAATATIVVQKDGTSQCSLKELLSFFRQEKKIIPSRKELEQRVRDYKKAGKTIVFTNGCFDIIHLGHIEYLREAKEFGDILIIGVNTDDSIRRLKGPERPINTVNDRMGVLAALEYVDHVIEFSEDRPENLIRIVKPDVYVKGGDYTKASLPETLLIEELGGRIEIVSYINDHSTTNIIKKIQAPQPLL